jgi:hypothetical protein
MEAKRIEKKLSCVIPAAKNELKVICQQKQEKQLQNLRQAIKNFIKAGILPRTLYVDVDTLTFPQVCQLFDLIFTSDQKQFLETPHFLVSVTSEQNPTGFPAPDEEKWIEVKRGIKKKVVPLINWKRFLPHLCTGLVLNPFQILRSILSNLKNLNMMPHLQDIDTDCDINLRDACLLLSELFHVPHKQFLSLDPDERARRDSGVLQKKDWKTQIEEYKNLYTRFHPQPPRGSEVPIVDSTKVANIISNYSMYGTGLSLIAPDKWRDDPSKTYSFCARKQAPSTQRIQEQGRLCVEPAAHPGGTKRKILSAPMEEQKTLKKPVIHLAPQQTPSALVKKEEETSKDLSLLENIFLYSSLFRIRDEPEKKFPFSDFVLIKVARGKTPLQILLYAYIFVFMDQGLEAILEVTCPITGRSVNLGGIVNVIEGTRTYEHIALGIDLTNQKWKDILGCKL